jgi:hypothetical protein
VLVPWDEGSTVEPGPGDANAVAVFPDAMIHEGAVARSVALGDLAAVCGKSGLECGVDAHIKALLIAVLEGDGPDELGLGRIIEGE